MKRTIFLLLTAGIIASLVGTSCEEPVTPPPPAPSEKAITAFSFTSPAATGVINEGAKTIAVTVPFGTDVTALVATFTTTGASIKVGLTDQVSGVTPNNFTAPVVYTVTAVDASTVNYTVTVTLAAAPKQITAYSFESIPATGVINEGAKTIAVTVPFGTNVTALVATFTYTGASVKVGVTDQVSGVTPNNFTAPVVYTVTAADAATVDYTVTVTIAPASSEKAILAYSFTSPAITGTINEGAKTIAVKVPIGTDRTNLAATFSLSTYASADIVGTPQVSGVTVNDFTNPVTYTITAQNGTTVDYTVTVTLMTQVLYANFQQVPAGMVDGTEITLPAPVALPTVTNTNGYTINLEGKVTIQTGQSVPAGTTGWSVGNFRSGNNTSYVGKITISSVPGPFRLTVNWIASTTGDATRDLRIVISGTEVYFDGDGQAHTVDYDYTGTGTVNIEIYGWDGTQGKGIRVFDLWLQQ